MDGEDSVVSQGREVKSIVQIGIVKNKTLYISAVNNSTVSRDDESEDNQQPLLFISAKTGSDQDYDESTLSRNSQISKTHSEVFSRRWNPNESAHFNTGVEDSASKFGKGTHDDDDIEESDT